MADVIITKQELIDAQKDAKTLEDVINGAANIQVTARLGRKFWTLATLNSKLNSVETAATQGLININNDVASVEAARVVAQSQINAKVASVGVDIQISSDAAEAAAVSAAESASIATSAAQNANSSANIAEAAATAATIGAGVFETPEAGVDPVTGVPNGAYYNVRSSSDESYIDEYQNVGGVPTPTGKSYPSAAVVADVVAAIIDPASGMADSAKLFDKTLGQYQDKINRNSRLNNVKDWGAVGTTALVSDWYTVGSANYRKYANLAALQADYPFIIDGTESIDYAGFQATVNFAISNSSNRIFIPFDNAEKYFINRTVTIPASGFVIDGNRSPSYQIRERGGYIYAPASVTDIFDYGCGGIQPSNQLIVNGVGAVGVATPHQSQNFIKHYNNNDGPHRGVLFTRTTAVRFQHVLYIKADVPSYISAGTVIFETGCVFTHNKNTAYAENRVFGFAMNSIQSEQGARVAGKFDGGVSFRDNMLEGQSNPITIDSNQPSLIMENNYFEAISGDYLAAFKGTNINALFDERPNFISTIYGTDIYRINGIARLHAPYRYHLRSERHSLYSFIGANLSLGSEFDGAGYIGTGDISTSGLYGFCNPSKLLPARRSAVLQKFVGSDVLETPFGKTYTGLKVVGTSPFNTLNKSWEIGDAVTAVALVKLKEGQAPNFSFYNSDGSLFAQVSQNTVSKMVQGWHVVVISGAATKASTTGRWRFTSDTEIEVAAVGVDVTPVADFKTFNSVQRAEIQVFNPLPLNAETHTYRDVRNLSIPAITSGAEYKTTSIYVFGASIGDVVVCSPNIDMQGLDWFVRVSAANTIELRIVNRTGASVTLGVVQWNTRVFK